MPGLSGNLKSMNMQSTLMLLDTVSIHHSEEGGEVHENIQCWEDGSGYGETGKEESRAVDDYKELFTKLNEFIDVYAEGSEIRKKL